LRKNLYIPKRDEAGSQAANHMGTHHNSDSDNPDGHNLRNTVS
jgi:hypothetical protein